jgi:hypothetical protein
MWVETCCTNHSGKQLFIVFIVLTENNKTKYSVFTKQWCGFKDLLNDYILRLDGAPPIFTGMCESY